MGIFRFLFKKTPLRIYFWIKGVDVCKTPFLPDNEIDILYGGFSLREITAAVKSVDMLYRIPMNMISAGYDYRETASILGISRRVLAKRVNMGHLLFMKALKKGRRG